MVSLDSDNTIKKALVFLLKSINSIDTILPASFVAFDSSFLRAGFSNIKIN